MRNVRRLGALVGLASSMALMVAGERDASACGGCIQPAPPPAETEVESVITDEKMIFSISQDQTTLYDEIEYSGSPKDFAWVLPVKGTVTVGLSADILFQTINALTATVITSPPTGCPPPPTCGGFGGGGCLASRSSGASFAGVAGDGGALTVAGTVTVTSQKQVGPYETVQLHSTDGSALTDWLAAHKYVLSKADAPVIAAYVADHFDFLALRLAPGEGVHAMQPVRVTSKGASISLPLHMVAVGTGATTGITIWVVADGRWEPQNFPTFTISDSDIAWDWASQSSNYETVRLAKEATFKGRGWQIESSLDLNKYTIEEDLSSSIEGDLNGVGGYAPAGDAGDGDAGEAGGSKASDAGSSDSSEAGSSDAVGGDADDASSSDAGSGEAGDAGSGGGADGGGEGDVDSGDFELGEYGLEPVARQDLAVLFAGIAGSNVRITRMRSDVAHSALSEDMVLKASTDPNELTNQHIAGQQIGQPLCPVYDDNCVQTGEVPRDQANSDASGSCNTTRSQSGARTTLALGLAIAAIGAVRLRRRRGKRAPRR
jgi:hypothetical protein